MLILHRHRTQHIVEIVCRRNFADSQNELSIEKLLSPPQLVQLGTVQWLRARQRIVALHAASLGICVLTVELQKLDTEAAAWPADQFLRIKASSDNKEPVEAPLARCRAGGKEAM